MSTEVEICSYTYHLSLHNERCYSEPNPKHLGGWYIIISLGRGRIFHVNYKRERDFLRERERERKRKGERKRERKRKRKRESTKTPSKWKLNSNLGHTHSREIY